MGQMKQGLWNNILFLGFCFASTISVLLYLSISHAISLDEFRFGIVLIVGCFFILNVYRYRRLRVNFLANSAEKREEIVCSTNLPKLIRTLQIAVVVLPVLLIFGLLLTRGAPLAPRLVGATINLSITFWFITLIRHSKKKLRSQ
jgi:hypothetical protein